MGDAVGGTTVSGGNEAMQGGLHLGNEDDKASTNFNFNFLLVFCLFWLVPFFLTSFLGSLL